MKNKALLSIILTLITIKLLLSLAVTTPTIYTDEYIYMKMAQSFFQNLNFYIHNIPTSNYPPLYPIILSISFIANNASIAYIIMKILNVLVSTLIIIPSYLLAKEFLETKKAIAAATIIALLPMNFVFPAFIMSENLFYTLFMLSIYLIYKSLTEKNYKYDILAGLSIGLTYLTKFAGISLVLIVLGLLIYKIINKEFYEIKKKIIMGIFSLLTISPWLVRNISMFGFTLKGLVGQYSLEITKEVPNYSLNMLYWILIYSGYILLASFIILIIFSSSNLKTKFKSKKLKILTILTILTVFIILIGAAQHAAKSGVKTQTNLPEQIGRPMGRYIDTALPIIFLLGIISYYKKHQDKKTAKNILLISIPLILIFSQALYFKLLPVNNITFTLLGVANLAINKVLTHKLSIVILTITLLAIPLILYFISKKNSINNIKPLKIIFIVIIITNLVAYAGIIHNSKTQWENHPQIELSKWISKNIDKNSKILIDEDFCGALNKQSHDVLCTEHKSTALTGLWILNPIDIKIIETQETDYIITKKELDLELLKNTYNNIYLYKAK